MNVLNKKVEKYSKFEKKKFPFVYAFIAFPVIQFLIFWVYVNFSSIMFAFLNKENALCFDHFVKVFEIISGKYSEFFNKFSNIFDGLSKNSIIFTRYFR